MNRTARGGRCAFTPAFARLKYMPVFEVQGRQPVLGFRLVHDGADRVNRGGSWNDGSRDAPVAGYVGDDPGIRYPDLGFRLVREDE